MRTLILNPVENLLVAVQLLAQIAQADTMIPFSHLARRPIPKRAKSRSTSITIFVLATMFALEQSASALPAATAQAGLVLTIEGTVEVSRAGTAQWASASVVSLK